MIFRRRIVAATTAAFGAIALASAAPAQDEASVASEMAAAAQALIEASSAPAFIANLQGVEPLEDLRHGLDADARDDWGYWPRARDGFALGYMSPPQRIAVHELLEALLSASGYLQIQAIFSLEEVLAATEQGSFPRGFEYAAVAVFGEPGGVEPWGWRLDSHHMSLNVTVTGDEVDVTPSFLGANPARVTAGDKAGLEPLRYETRAAFALLNSLEGEARRQVVVTEEAPRDILSGQLNKPRETWDDWQEAITRQGVNVDDMSPEQRALAVRLLDEIVGRYRPEIAEAQRAAIDVDDLSFAWMGSTEEGAPYYFKLVGDTFVYEYDASGPDGNHVHTVWRDRADDFGAAALERHYAAEEH